MEKSGKKKDKKDKKDRKGEAERTASTPREEAPVVGSVLLRQLHGAADGDLAERARIMIHLSDKVDGLLDTESALGVIARATTDEAVRATSLERRKEAVAEREACISRIAAINHNGGYVDPGPGAEQALLDALDAVTTAAANTQAVVALFEAAHALIAAYPAGGTGA